MQSFTFRLPTQVIFGVGQESRTGAAAAATGAKRVLVHYGQGSVLRSGLKDRIVGQLQAAGLRVSELGGVEPNPRLGLVRTGIALAKAEGCLLYTSDAADDM
jgi:alcohol dehydrogenase YqhD (iron-dependent ADH family)